MLNYGENRALDEIQSIIDSQWESGMLPQIRFVPGQGGYSPNESEWGVTRKLSGLHQDTSGITQPPILGYALQKMVENAEHKAEMLLTVEKFYKPVEDYHKFLFRDRDPDHEGIVSVLHPWETGTDNSPYMDAPVQRSISFLKAQGYKQPIDIRRDLKAVSEKQRPISEDYECYGRLISLFAEYKYDQAKILRNSPFVIQDLLFNVILAASVRALVLLADQFSTALKDKRKCEEYHAKKEKHTSRYDKLVSAIQEKLYVPEADTFYSYDMFKKEHLRSDTIHCLSPVFGGCATPQQAESICRRIENDFNTEVLIPSVSVKEKTFEELRYWRGPVWPVTNWIIYEGLAEYAVDPDATLVRKTASQVLRETIQTIEMRKAVSRKEAYDLAASLMEYNSHRDPNRTEPAFTTPSKTQYYHGWFWDSCLAAIGWVNIREEPPQTFTEKWEQIQQQVETLRSQMEPAKAYAQVLRKCECVLFDEYYVPRKYHDDDRDYDPGAPIGAPMMTWTASLYLDMRKSLMRSKP